MYNIIGDIAGDYDTLMALVAKMPPGIVVSVGDMVDRGYKSAEVVEFFASGKGLAVLGNHEHMMLDALTHPTDVPNDGSYYGFGVWDCNGGSRTIYSYVKKETQDWSQALLECGLYVPQYHIEFLRSLPLFLEFPETNFLGETLFISHAPVNPAVPFARTLNLGDSAYSKLCEDSIIWNRGTPRRMPGKLQVYGHNTYKHARWHTDEFGNFAVGIDTGGRGKLTGLHWPSMQTFEQERIVL